MKTLFSDSMMCPRWVDASTVDYRFPVTSAGNEAVPTRTRRDGYRSKPIKLETRSIEITGSFRTGSKISGFLSLYLWKPAADIAYKNPYYTPSVQMSSIGNRFFGELPVAPHSSVGTTFNIKLVFDEDVEFIQLYNTMDLSAVSIYEGDGTGTLVRLLVPRPVDDPFTIADDFELYAPPTPILIEDQFNLGANSDPSVIP